MTHETILSSLEAANEFVTMQGFEPLPEAIKNPCNRIVGYNHRGQMMMARVFLNWQEIGNVVIQVKIVE